MEPDISFPVNWAPPDELARPLPRKLRITRLGRLQAILGIAPIVAAIGLFLLMEHQISSDNARNLALETQGVTTPGRVLQLWGGGRNSTPKFSYSFMANGVRQEGYADIPAGFSNRIRRAINHPADWEESRTPAWFPFFLPPGLVLFGFLFLKSLGKEHRLLAKGLAAPAVVTRCYQVKGGWTAHYQFRTRDGALGAGRGNSSNKLETGTHLCVVYDPRKPARVRTYPMNAYRVE
jgi:hypothetical protein